MELSFVVSRIQIKSPLVPEIADSSIQHHPKMPFLSWTLLHIWKLILLSLYTTQQSYPRTIK